MTIRKTDAGWQVDVSFQGLRIRHKLPGTVSHFDAKRKEIEIAECLTRHGQWPAPDVTDEARRQIGRGEKLDLMAAFERCKLVGVRKAKRSTPWAASRSQHGTVAQANFENDIWPFWQTQPSRGELAHITETEVAAFKAHLQRRTPALAPSTINNKLSTLSMVLRAAMQSPPMAVNLPMPDRVEGSRKRQRILTREEEAECYAFFEDTGRPDFADIVKFGLYGGLIFSEIWRLAGRDFEFHTDDNGRETAMLRLNLSSYLVGKTNDRRTVATIPAILAAVAKRRIAIHGHGLLFPGWDKNRASRAWDSFRDHMGQAGNADFVFYMLRHTCATRLAEATGDPFVVKDYMRHGSLQTTMGYIHATPRMRARAAEVFDAAG